MKECGQTKEKKEINQGSECTYLSISISDQQISQRGNKKEDRQESFQLEPTSHQHMPELDFISISKKYEMLLISKKKKPFMNQSEEDEGHKQPIYRCFCGKEMKFIKGFVCHVESSHRFAVESLSFLKAYRMLKEYKLSSNFFKLDIQDYLNNITKCHCNNIKLPEEMMILPQKFRQELMVKLQRLIKMQIPSQNMFISNSFNILPHNNYFFSENIMQYLRTLIIKHVQVFDRNISVHLKNMVFKDLLFLFLFNLSTLLKEVKERTFGKRTKNKPIFGFSSILECVCRDFLNWLDLKYLTILQKHQIFWNYLQLEKDELYSENERLSNFQIFIKQYLRFTRTKHLGESVKRTTQFFIQSSRIFFKMVTQEDELFENLEQKLHQ